MAETKYVGRRTTGGCRVCREEKGRMTILPTRTDLWNHSPTGFEWGYGGSGPAQLALAILCDALEDDETAADLHQMFKWAFVAHMPKGGWVLTKSEIVDWAKLMDQQRADRQRLAQEGPEIDLSAEAHQQLLEADGAHASANRRGVNRRARAEEGGTE